MEEKKQITTIDDVSSYFRKIKFLEDKQEELKVQAEREFARVKEWLESELEPLQGKQKYYEGEILRYHAEQKAINPKVKVTTPYGKVATRKSKTWNYDEPVLIEYLKENAVDLIKVKTTESIDKTSLKNKFAEGVNPETGEVVPGITIEQTESISLKVN